MPKLPTFTADVGNAGTIGGRRATAADFGGEVGQALQTAGQVTQKGAQQINQMLEEEDVRKVQLQAAKLRADQTAALWEATQSGGDFEALGQDFDNKLQDLGTLPTTGRGRGAAALIQEQARREFDLSIARAKVTRSAEQAAVQYTDYMTTAAATVAADPSQSEIVKDGFAVFVQTFSGLSPEAKDRMLREGFSDLDSASVSRMTDIDPDFTLQELQRNPDAWSGLDPKERVAAIGLAQQEIQNRETRGRAEIRFREYERGIRGDMAYNEISKKMMFPRTDGERGQALDEAAQNEDISGPQRIALHALYEKLSEDAIKPIVSDPQVVRQLYERITVPFGATRKVRNTEELDLAFIQGKLSSKDLVWLKEMFAFDQDGGGRGFIETAKPFLDSMRKRLDKSTLAGDQDPEGALRYSQFLQEFWTQHKSMRDNNLDPRALVDAKNTEFAGNWPSALQRPFLEVLRETAGKISPKPVKFPTTQEFIAMPALTTTEEVEALAPGTVFKTASGKMGIRPQGPLKKNERQE